MRKVFKYGNSHHEKELDSWLKRLDELKYSKGDTIVNKSKREGAALYATLLKAVQKFKSFKKKNKIDM